MLFTFNLPGCLEVNWDWFHDLERCSDVTDIYLWEMKIEEILICNLHNNLCAYIKFKALMKIYEIAQHVLVFFFWCLSDFIWLGRFFFISWDNPALLLPHILSWYRLHQKAVRFVMFQFIFTNSHKFVSYTILSTRSTLRVHVLPKHLSIYFLHFSTHLPCCLHCHFKFYLCFYIS